MGGGSVLYLIRLVLFFRDAVNDFLDKNCSHVAGAISFYTLFSFFPLVLAVISIAAFLQATDAGQEQLAHQIALVIPVETDYIVDRVHDVVQARGPLGVVSVLGLLWASTAVFGAIRKGINAAWGIKSTRPFLKERMIDFALVLGAGLVVIVFLFVTPFFALLHEFTTSVPPEVELVSGFLWSLIAQLLSPMVSFLSFLFLYRFLPNTGVQVRDVWLGALGASMAFECAKWVFVWYLNTFPVYNVVYGPIGAVMALLTWVYVSATILLFGAHLASRYASFPIRIREERGLKLLWTGLARVRLRVVAMPVG